jgi:hypothetical protein
MYRRFFIAVAAIAALVSISIYLVNRHDPHLNKPIAAVVADKGTPDFVLDTFDIEKKELKILRLMILPKDPLAVTDWNAITNAFLMWVKSDDGKFTARYYFEKMKKEKDFDGTDWYSTRSLFMGEKVTFVLADSTGHSLGKRTYWVDAFSMYLKGVAPRKPGVHRIPTASESKE